MSDPRYPIGKFKFEGPPSEAERNQFIDDIEQTPAALRAAIKGLSPEQIETPYRDGGWTVRQVVPVAKHEASRMEAQLPPSRVRVNATGEESGALRLARQASCGPHHGVEEEDGLVGELLYAGMCRRQTM
jgi:hypothetical protein